MFKEFKIDCLNKFPQFNQIFQNYNYLNCYKEFLLDFQEKEVRDYYQKKILECFENGMLNNEKSIEIILALFGVLYQDFLKGNTENINRFLLYIFSLVQSQSEFSFELLIELLEEFKKEFILFAKIFLQSTIKQINKKVDFDKEKIFECFTTILTLSYLDKEEENIFKLDPLLVDNYKIGK